MRRTFCFASLVLSLPGCPDDGEGTTAADPTSSASTAASTSGDPPSTGTDTSSSSDASSSDTSTDVDASSSSSSSSSDASSSNTSTGLAPCDGADEALILSAFATCEQLPGYLGQTVEAAGVTCAEVCCVFEFSGCSHRAAQSGLEGCPDEPPAPTGDCEDVFEQTWSNHCVCTT